MTAKSAGKLAAVGFWSGLKTLRDQWVLLFFVATLLYGARDIYDEFSVLPARVEALHGEVTGLRGEFAVLDQRVTRTVVERTPALRFPGTKHRIADGRPGRSVTVRFEPVVPVRFDCRAGELAAYMIDATGMWFAVETALGRLPQLDGAQELAFGVRIHPRMAVGRAEFLMQLTHDCGTHLQVDRSPRLPFRVLGHRAASQN